MDQTAENFRVFCSIQHKTADNSRQLNLKHLLVTAVKFLKSFSGKIEKIEFRPQIKKKNQYHTAMEQNFFDLVKMSSKVIAKC